MLERYAYGNDAQTKWLSFSVAKSIASTLVGAAVKDGFIHSLDDRVTTYVPQLKGSAYDEVTVKQIAFQMSSGVKWSEDYLDPESERRKMLRRCRSHRIVVGAEVHGPAATRRVGRHTIQLQHW